ncbi:MAG: hypothetical protein IKX87_00035 [Lachnospiraceae bacterium]|nr:hypothetical protein [Lachnospiraceae bacterium]
MKKERAIGTHFKRVLTLIAAFVITFALFPPMISEAATDSAKVAFRKEIIGMLCSADETTHDVSKYQLSGADVNGIFGNLKYDDETKWLVAAYYSNLYLNYSVEDGYVKSVNLENVDSDALARYNRLAENVKKIKDGIEPKMSNLDKIIYLHDSIVELATYQMVAYESYGAGGVLGDKKGVCAGYTKALNLLLIDQNIIATYMRAPSISHGWTSIYLDGEWYHIDSTWDDTRSAKKGQTSHQFLLRNDSEFVTNDNNSHVAWEVYDFDFEYTSTSTRFSNWYVHDITGKMAFENGYWYYVDSGTNSIMQNTAEGGNAKVILDGTGRGTITLVDATPSGITYLENGTTKTAGYEANTTQNNTTVTGTKATVYLAKEGSSTYTAAGTAMLKEAKTSKNSDVVTGNILSLPNLSKYVASNQYVKWTAITKSSSGKFSLKGTIYTSAVQNEPVVEEETVKPTVSATFYLKGIGSTSYKEIGKGLLYKDETSSNTAKITANIGQLPNVSSYLKDGEYIVWTKISKSSSGKISVKGEIRK